MMKPRTQLNFKNFLWKTLYLFILVGSPLRFAQASKVDLSAGSFQMQSENKRNDSSGSLSGFGSYRAAYKTSFASRYEIDLGYSLIASKTFSGDLSFGPDLGLNYYFLSDSEDFSVKAGESFAVFRALWRPYLGASFHQRNFQSTSSQYVGPGFKIGSEYQLQDSMSLHGFARFMNLAGPNQSKSTILEIFLGMTFHL